MLEEKALEICISAGIKKVLFHCFTGNAQTVVKITEAGFYVSFSGIVTFKKDILDDAVKATPLDKILVETDSPWLAPVPHRGERNEPSYIRFIGEKIAEIYRIDEKFMANRIKENTEKFFNVSF
jgi:TatD DNase family protein